jgi:lysyl-tRNA synthetase class 2
MATLKELRDERLRKLEELKKLGVNPYPANAERSHELKQITDNFDQLQGQTVQVVGRIQNIRKFGKIAFIVLKDMSGSLQLFLGADQLAELQPENSQLGFAQLPLLDSGDFLQANGEVIKTKPAKSP